MSPGLRERIEGGDLLLISKTNRASRVHRRARMDSIDLKRIDAHGDVVGELRLIGLFTSLVYMEQAARTPLLRRKLRSIVAAEDLIEGSHDYKATVSVFESFPRDELFQAGSAELRAEVMAVLAGGRGPRRLRRAAPGRDRQGRRRARRDAARPLRLGRAPAPAGAPAAALRG